MHPNELKNLPTGHAIVIRKTHGVHVAYAHIDARRP